MSTTFDEGKALCAPFLSALPVAGLSISVGGSLEVQSIVGTSDLIASRLEELQFQLGEGPTPVALRDGVPVLAPDLQSDRTTALWPVFAPAAVDTGARGMFSFPLLVGHATVGVVSLYALVLGPAWSAAVLKSATTLADAVVRPAMALATRAAAEDPPPGRRQVELRREVHQAAGMVMVQLDTSIEQALARLRAHSFATGRSVDVVSNEVIDGMLDFRRMDE